MLDELKDRTPGNRLTHAGAPSQAIREHDAGDGEESQRDGGDRGDHEHETANAA